MNSFLVRFLIMFAVVFGAIFMLVWFYLSVTAPVEAGELQPPSPQQSTQFAAGQVIITAGDGRTHTFDVEIASTPAQQRRGLMFRDHLSADQGMLFDFQPPRQVAMWMKNTYIPLDMLFADETGRVVFIAQNTQPHSLDMITGPEGVRYVLELPAGTAVRLGLAVGDRLQR
ncbi:DUF192 domain-containing protein [Pseudomonadota bacterium]